MILHDPAAVFRYFGIDEFVVDVHFQRASVPSSSAHQPAVAGNIGREDGHEPSLHSLVGQSAPPSMR